MSRGCRPWATAGLLLALTGADASLSAEIRVLCTTVPIQALATGVADGVEGVSVELLLDPAVGCPHDYALTPRDRQRLADARLILANGLGLDAFIPRGAAGLPPIVEVTSGCELLEGGCAAQADDHAGHSHDHGPNPHVWLSPTAAARMTRNIGDALSKLAPDKQSRFQSNAERYAERLEALAGEFAAAAERIKGTRVAATAEVFDYLARDLKLEVIVGLPTHASEGVSPRALSDAIAAIEKHGGRAVLYERGSRDRLAETVARNAKVPAVALDALSRSDRPVPPPDWYEAQTRANLAAILKAVEGK